LDKAGGWIVGSILAAGTPALVVYMTRMGSVWTTAVVNGLMAFAAMMFVLICIQVRADVLRHEASEIASKENLPTADNVKTLIRGAKSANKEMSRAGLEPATL